MAPKEKDRRHQARERKLCAGRDLHGGRKGDWGRDHFLSPVEEKGALICKKKKEEKEYEGRGSGVSEITDLLGCSGRGKRKSSGERGAGEKKGGKKKLQIRPRKKKREKKRLEKHGKRHEHSYSATKNKTVPFQIPLNRGEAKNRNFSYPDRKEKAAFYIEERRKRGGKN